MKEIKLTRGMVALVDDEDYEALSQHNWYVSESKKHNTIKYYAARQSRNKGKRVTTYMHRTILNAPPSLQVDHKNGNGLDNRRANLRLATQSQNNANKDNPSPSRGVSWNKERGKFDSQIKVNGKHIHLGRFSNPVDAARSYNEAALEHFGEFARLNQLDT